MSFEEQFPSLFNNGYSYDTDLVNVSEIIKFCLDKQKVIEAIRKLQDGKYNFGLLPDEEGYEYNHCEKIDGNELLKELGL